MQDTDFLLQALKQAFLHPIVHSVNGVSFIDYTGITDCLRFCDDRHGMLLPSPLPLKNIKKYAQSAARAVNRRHNPRLYAEYDAYKHDLIENVVMPNDFPQLLQAKKLLDMVEVNRQSAQKKKVVATLFPSEFLAKYKLSGEEYTAAVRQAEQVLLNNQNAYDVALISDFAAAYKKIIGVFNISDFMLWVNKKRFRYYLNEAAQLLKSKQVLSVDFYEDHPFHGENYEIARHKIMQCKNNLKQLLFLLQKMAHNPRLLSMAQDVIAHRKNFAQTLSEYRAEHKCDNFSAISALRHNMQDLFNKYAFMIYLDGVRFAFENKYLNECPIQRYPSLLTVSPQDEIKKIAKIVDESRKIDAESGKIKQIYMQALKDYTDSYQRFTASLKKI